MNYYAAAQGYIVAADAGEHWTDRHPDAIKIVRDDRRGRWIVTQHARRPALVGLDVTAMIHNHAALDAALA